MNEYEANQTPEQIEKEVERSRAEVSSTIDAIQSKLTPGQMMDQALGYARTSLPADFGANLGNTVRDNPMPVALIGVGIAWLMSSGRYADGHARARRQAIRHEGQSMAGSSVDYDATYGVTSATDMEAGSDEGKMQRAAAKASEAGRGLKEKASEIGHRISDSTAAITGRARDLTHSARERAQGAGGSARARLDQASHRSQEQYYRAKSRVSHMAEEQPLMLGALGLAVGTLLGALLPSTRREDELMGRTRDDLLDRAKQTAQEQAETVKESAQRVAGAAKQEAERVRDEHAASAKGNGRSTHTGASESVVPVSGAQGQQLPH